LPAKFAMVITPASTPPALREEEPGAAELAARIASGPGFWTDWLAELGRQGLLEELLAEGVIARALREAPTGHRYDRVLTAKMTVICVLVACLFPGAGYDAVLATAFGLPGLRRRPGRLVAPAGRGAGRRPKNAHIRTGWSTAMLHHGHPHTASAIIQRGCPRRRWSR
jgi:hypothetical protein